MAQPANATSSPAVEKPSEPEGNGQLGAAAGEKHVAGAGSEGYEAIEAAGGKLHRSVTLALTFVD